MKTPYWEEYISTNPISTGFQPVNTRKRCFGVTFWCHLGLVKGALPCISVHFSTKKRSYAQAKRRALFVLYCIYFVGFMAERGRFELPIALRLCLISSQVHSTGLCHLSLLINFISVICDINMLYRFHCRTSGILVGVPLVSRLHQSRTWCSGARWEYRMKPGASCARAALRTHTDQL